MLRPIDDFFLNKEEPIKSCLQSLREYVLKKDGRIVEAWKYGMPFYCLRGKMICYLWVHKKFRQPYFGIVEGKKMDHPDLLAEKRSRMKILLIDPAMDLPLDKINTILSKMLLLYN